MVFSISIGDALMLAKIAYTLGRAFTSGRSSAPTEFMEVQNLLYTLSESLKLLARDLPERPENGVLQNESKPNMAEDGDTILVHIVANCRSTLAYLEGFVAKYMELDSGNPVEASTRIGERWKEEVRKNWKKLRWTTEGGGLEKLKTMLNAQINGLDLALSALNRHHGKIVHERVDTMYTQLDEIYQWFAANLKGYRAAYTSETRETESSDGMSARSLNFVVYAQLPGSTQRVLLCPKGSFNDLQTLDDKDADGRTILGCCCAPSTSPSNSAMRGNVRPHSWQLRFSLLPVSFLICSAEPHGHREYQIYAASPNSNVPMLVYITKLAPTDLARLENYANELAALQAAHHAKRGLSSMLLHPSRTNFGEESMSILAMKTDVSDLIDSLLSLRFVANGHHFTQGRVESFQLLHFKSLPTRYLRSTLHEAYTGITHQQYAELVLHCDPSSSNATRYFVQIEYDTPIKRGDNPQVANLGDVLCVAEGDHDGAESVQQIKCSTLELEFLSLSAAEEFVDRIKAIQRELFILYLQYPRLGEQVVYQRPIGDLMVRDFYLADAGMSVIRNPTTSMYRLVLLNKLHSVSVCFENIASGSLAAVDSLAWFVQIGSESTSIVQQPAEVSFTLSTLGQTAPLFQQDQINEPGVKSPAVEEC